MSGCAKEEWSRFWQSFEKEKGQQPEATPRARGASKALQGAIGPLVTIEGAQLMEVRGYGLVVDLVDTGGPDGPQQIKDYLVKEVRKNQQVGMPGIATKDIFEGRDSAMVEVLGWIPAAAKKGDRFDVIVKALGSQSKSLVGGRLVLCELKLYAESPQGVIEGKTLATASGPVFVSIFDAEGRTASKVDLRAGIVMGGGVVKEPRRLRLVLSDPRYAVAQQIVARINGRYAALDPIAEGKSASTVDIKIPDEYRARKRLFLERVAHTTLQDDPSHLEKRAAELAQELEGAEPDTESIGLAWEAIGKLALPSVKGLYRHGVPDVRYCAARTGMRLGDNAGMEEMVKFALDTDSKFRMAAIDELGFAATMYGAGEALKKLLDDPEDDVRIRAYRALRRRPHPVIETKVLDKDNFILDVINCGGPFMIHVQRLSAPRIAVFGSQLRCEDNAMFPGDRRDGRRLLTQLSANPGEKSLTVIYKNKRNRKQSEPLPVSFNVGEMITFLGGAPTKDEQGKVQGLAVPYSEIVDILYTLCEQQSIPAKLTVEDLKEAEEAPVEETRERQESEY
jgi:hypothetical protein